MRTGERQIAPSLEGIRRDHVARYEWAARLLPEGSRVVDLAGGIGYGSRLLADNGHDVTGLDRDLEALEYGRKHFSHARVCLWRADMSQLHLGSNVDAAVCFETIEHVQDPRPMLRELARVSPRLLASVPNESVFPWQGHAYHFRHYTRAEFGELLAESGWKVIKWFGQAGGESEVEPDVDGRTLIAMAERTEAVESLPPSLPVPFAMEAPEHVVILGLGPSLEAYVDLVKRLGGRRAFSDEVWGINAAGDVIRCDRIFHMDDVLVQEGRAAERPRSNIANMLGWLRSHDGPIYTSMRDADGRDRTAYPGLVEYPLADVINSTGQAYFNSTAAYAVAFAIHIGVKKISLFGFDFTYAKSHDAEKGRGCVEFWLGKADERGIEIGIADRSSLMDMCEPEERRIYGYDAVKVHIAEQQGGPARVIFTPRGSLPSANDIEARYDHSKHPNPLVGK